MAAISAGIFGGGLSALAAGGLIGAGTIGLFLGMALLAPRLVTPLARLVGWPARRAGGVAGERPRPTRFATPGRTASTAAALMTLAPRVGARCAGSLAPERLRSGLQLPLMRAT